MRSGHERVRGVVLVGVVAALVRSIDLGHGVGLVGDDLIKQEVRAAAPVRGVPLHGRRQRVARRVLAVDRLGARAECEGVGAEEPQHRHDAGDHQRLHQGGEHVLATDHAAVEERQTRQGHEQDQRAGHQHPAVVTGVEGGLVRRGVGRVGGGGRGGDGGFDGRHARFHSRRRRTRSSISRMAKSRCTGRWLVFCPGRSAPRQGEEGEEVKGDTHHCEILVGWAMGVDLLGNSRSK